MSPDAQFILESSLKTIDLTFPKPFQKRASSSDNAVDLIAKKNATISKLDEFVYEWATKKDLEFKEVDGTVVYEADLQTATIEKVGIQPMKSKDMLMTKLLIFMHIS